MATPITIGAAGGEYMEAVVVLEWTAKLNAPVKKEDVIVVVETAKASSEILAPCDGFLTAIFFNEGDEAPVSEVLGLIGATPEDKTAGEAPVAEEAVQVDTAAAAEPATHASAAVVRHVGRVIASPLARAEAARLGVDLAVVPVTSASGRIKLQDVISAQGRTPATARAGQTSAGALNVTSMGSGQTTVLMIHGFGADAMSWYPVSKPLSSSYRVIALDLPNHGRSPHQATATFDALVGEVVRAVDGIDVARLHVVGHSLGAACAVALAAQRPDRVSSLTLLAPAGCGAGVNTEFVHGLANADSPETLKGFLEMLVADRSLVSREFLGAVLSSRATPGLVQAQQQMAHDLFPLTGSSTVDVSGLMASLKCPLQILWGLSDSVISLHEARQLPTNARISVLPAVGHAPQLEAPQAVLEHLTAIIGKVEDSL